jgi:hypothetical protein
MRSGQVDPSGVDEVGADADAQGLDPPATTRGRTWGKSRTRWGPAITTSSHKGYRVSSGAGGVVAGAAGEVEGEWFGLSGSGGIGDAFLQQGLTRVI